MYQTKLIGKLRVSFLSKDGQKIEGYTFYYSEPLDANKGATGVKADKFFLKDETVNSLDFTPEVGQYVQLYFNKYGKIMTIALQDAEKGIDV